MNFIRLIHLHLKYIWIISTKLRIQRTSGTQKKKLKVNSIYQKSTINFHVLDFGTISFIELFKMGEEGLKAYHEITKNINDQDERVWRQTAAKKCKFSLYFLQSTKLANLFSSIWRHFKIHTFSYFEINLTFKRFYKLWYFLNKLNILKPIKWESLKWKWENILNYILIHYEGWKKEIQNIEEQTIQFEVQIATLKKDPLYKKYEEFGKILKDNMKEWVKN